MCVIGNMLEKNIELCHTDSNVFGLSTIIHIKFYNSLMCLKRVDRMTNSVDPDQTAPIGAV